MKNTIKRVQALLLTLVMVVGMSGLAQAASESNSLGITFSVELNQASLNVSSENQSVTMTIKSNKGMTLDGVGYDLTCDSPLTLTGITSSQLTGITGADYNLTAKKFGWSTSDAENISDITEIGVITFTIPANTPAGTYTVGVKNIEITKDYGGITWENSATASATITITDPGSATHTHAYGAPAWSWTGDETNGFTATATFTCTGTTGTCDVPTKAVTAAVTGPVTVAATCTTAGSKTWTATAETYSDTKVVTIPAEGHSMTKTDAKAATCTDAGNNAYWTCSVCGKVFSDANGNTLTTVAQQTIPATGHTYENGTCSVCGEVQGAYEVYYELYDSNGATKLTANIDNDANGSLDVEANTSYVAKVFIKPNANKSLRGFELNLTYDSANLTVATSDTGKKYDTVDSSVAGALKYVLYQPEEGSSTYYEMAANTGLQVAQFTFTVNENTPADTAMVFGFGVKNEVSVKGATNAVAVSTKTSAYMDTLPEHTVTWNAGDGTFGSSTTMTTTVGYGEAAVAPIAPTRTAYTFEGWYLSTDNTQAVITDFPQLYANTEYAAKWTATKYTITFDTDGGTGDTSDNTYTIEDGTLPTLTKPGYTFAGWKVTNVTGDSNLSVDDVINSLTGKYGTVTLTAQWTVNASFALVDYTYAPTDYALLIVSAAPGDGNTVLYDGTPMFHIAEADAVSYAAKVTNSVDGADGVYVTLIPASTAEIASKITIGAGTATEITYNYQIDSDTDVDFNDASIVYQMAKLGGSQFSMTSEAAEDYLSIEARLRADANKDCTGTIEDVAAIVNNFS